MFTQSTLILGISIFFKEKLTKRFTRRENDVQQTLVYRLAITPNLVSENIEIWPMVNCISILDW